MATRLNGVNTRLMFRLFESGTVAGLSESELIDRFVIRRDPLAFEALVVRHGPMVLGVCKRFLHDPNDVDDAFQATFLVLVKKASRIRDRERLAPWLHGVARHVSQKARSQRLKLSSRVEPIDTKHAATETSEHPLASILDDELSKLSAGDRLAIVLCDLNGLTGDEAAQSLGIRGVAFRSRLHRARMRLKDRLERRGIMGGAGLTTLALSTAVPEALAAATLKSALAYAASSGAGTVVSLTVLTLTQGAFRTMMITKLKAAGAVLAVAAGLAGSTAIVVGQVPDDSKRPAAGTKSADGQYEVVYRPVNQPKDGNQNDRLRDVEAKLDRILQALDRPQSTLAPTPPHYVGHLSTTTANLVDQLAQPPKPLAPRTAVVRQPGMPASTFPQPPQSYGFSPLEVRVMELEKKIRSLEERLKALEPASKSSSLDVLQR